MGKMFALKNPSLILVASLLGIVMVATPDPARSQDSPQELPKPTLKTTPPLFQEWGFDKQQPETPPSGFSSTTLGKSQAEPWNVQVDSSAPSQPHTVVTPTGCANSSCFNLLLAKGTDVQYVDLSVRLKMELGVPHSKGGLVFGAQDGQSFYAVVVLPKTNTLEAFVIQEGKATKLEQATLNLKANDWHYLRIRRSTLISIELIEVFFDDQMILSFSNAALRSGQVGLVTFGQGRFAFDNLRAMEILTSLPLSRPPAY